MRVPSIQQAIGVSVVAIFAVAFLLNVPLWLEPDRNRVIQSSTVELPHVSITRPQIEVDTSEIPSFSTGFKFGGAFDLDNGRFYVAFKPSDLKPKYPRPGFIVVEEIRFYNEQRLSVLDIKQHAVTAWDANNQPTQHARYVQGAAAYQVRINKETLFTIIAMDHEGFPMGDAFSIDWGPAGAIRVALPPDVPK